MGKNKLKRWAELDTFERVFQPRTGVETSGNHLKGNWHAEVFHNDHPIVLELGCGRGEYTVNMGMRHPEKNFIGIDIKGARLWRGAKTANENKMLHVAFLRTQIELLEYFFQPGEVSEIWITFPDPHAKQIRENKRLTSPSFLNAYRNILGNKGLLHLKTDNEVMYQYTLEVLNDESGSILYHSNDLYREPEIPGNMDIETTYEKMFMEKGMTIKYLKFSFIPK
jgi:tRNA (guanine-N7-)-methyltransferase